MKNILYVIVLVLAIAMVAMPSFGVDVEYSATVKTGQTTSAVLNNTNFGSILRGTDKILNNSVTLNNTGDINATVDARFKSNVSLFYGLVNGSNVIGAGNFSLKNSTDENWHVLVNNGNDILGFTTVPFGSTRILDARLQVPAYMAGGSYNGTILLTFGNE